MLESTDTSLSSVNPDRFLKGSVSLSISYRVSNPIGGARERKVAEWPRTGSLAAAPDVQAVALSM